jgi:hypothetical protein
MRAVVSARLGAPKRPTRAEEARAATPARTLAVRATRFEDEPHAARLRVPAGLGSGTVIDLDLPPSGYRVLRTDQEPDQALVLFGRSRTRRKWKNVALERVPRADSRFAEALRWLEANGVRRVQVALDSGRRVRVALHPRAPTLARPGRPRRGPLPAQ